MGWEDFFNHPWFDEPISLPNELTRINPEFKEALDDCLVIAELADNLASEYGRHGEMLTLYLKFLSEMRDLFRDIDEVNSKRIFQEHYSMYLAKATQMAETTQPQGVPEKLIFAAFMQ